MVLNSRKMLRSVHRLIPYPVQKTSLNPMVDREFRSISKHKMGRCDIMKVNDAISKGSELFSDENESTELTLFVRTSDEELKKWDRSKIFDALMRETSISEDAASIVAREVEKMIEGLEIEFITAPLIREQPTPNLSNMAYQDKEATHSPAFLC